MIDRQEARSDVARFDPAADRWLHTANRARATTDPRRNVYSNGFYRNKCLAAVQLFIL
jgi:hypothetical protein